MRRGTQAHTPIWKSALRSSQLGEPPIRLTGDRGACHRRIFAALAVAAICALGLLLGLAFHGAVSEPLNPEPYMRSDASPALYDRRGELLYAYLNDIDHWSYPVDLEDVSPHLIEATLAAEDQRFREHAGVDPWAVLRAAAQNIWHRRLVSGASTLTMQVVKLNDGPVLGFRDKAVQALKAMRLERALDKEAILTAYLNNAPYGMNLLGCEAASRRYFGKPARGLSLAEAALLAGLPKAPGDLMPLNEPERAMARRNHVLARMLADGRIDETSYRAAVAEPLGVKWHDFPRSAPHVAMHLRDEAERRGDARLTIDARTQRLAETHLKQHVAGYRGVTNGAVVILDPWTGDVLARLGSQDFFDTPGGGQVDLTRAPRSPGSALKPFTYALAMEEHRLYPSEALLDESLDFGVYRPANFDGRFRGITTAASALRMSLNIPAVSVLNRVGYGALYGLLQDLDFTTLTQPAGHYGLGLTLGSSEVRLLELTGAYGALAAQGRYHKPRMLMDEPRAEAKAVFSPGVAAAIEEMLRQPIPAEALPAQLIRTRGGGELAWKTGTSSGLRDAWAFVYGRGYVVGVWMGNNDGSPAQRLVGAQAALPLAAALFRELPARETPRAAPRRELMRAVTVCSRSGMPATPWCGVTQRVEMPRELYELRRCGVHYPRAAAPQTAAAVGERWPGGARTWDLAEIRSARGAPDSGRSRTLEIKAPADEAEYVLTGEEDADRIRLRSSLDRHTPIHWYLNGKYLGRSAGDEPLHLDLDTGEHRLTAMTDDGTAKTIAFSVVRPDRGPLL